jgi:hypothetical protein
MLPLTINVNFHFRGSYDTGEGVALVNKIMTWWNNYLEDLPQCVLPGPTGVIPDRIAGPIWKVELYSEPSVTHDIYGGIWFEDIQSNTNVYDDKVIDIWLNDNSICFKGFSNTGADITMFGFSETSTCYDTDSNFGWMVRTINHELGHSLNLNHSSWCDNQCKNVDIDPELECDPNCPSLATCDNWNPGNVICPGSNTPVSICTWGTGNNMMSQGFNLFCLTPCQWEAAYNYVATRKRSLKYVWAEDCSLSAPAIRIQAGEYRVFSDLLMFNSPWQIRRQFC